MKLLYVERSIVEYKTMYEKIQEIIIDISVEEIKQIVTADDDDPLYYDGYILTKEQIEQIIQLKSINLSYNLDKYYYVLECGGIYE